jgi:hypothetical protein
LTFDDSIIAQITTAVQHRRGKPLANGEFNFLCPAHGDQNPSACWNPVKGVWHCFACGAKGGWRDLAGRLGIETRAAKGRSEIVAAYDYRDADGKLLYQACRMPGKKFLPRRPDGNGDWIWNLEGVPRVLYRLPELLDAVKRGEIVFIPEGEKDVENLTKLGLTATTNAGGAGKWRAEYSKHLSGANVVVLPDADEPGRKHAEQVAKSLRGVAASVKVLELPGLPEKGDISDWLAAGGTREQLERLAAEVPEWGPGRERERGPRTRAQLAIVTTSRFLREITADTLQALAAANDPPELYKVGSEIVRVGVNDLAEPLSVAALRGRMDRVADYIKFNKDGEEVPARPPEDVARDILALPTRELPFPALRGVRHAPLFLPCGRLLAADGYDSDSGWLMRLRGLTGAGGNMPLDEAKRWLEELLCDFPFEDPASKAHAVALLLQPFVRELVDGPTPLYLIDAPARGTGKGLLADILTSVATGGDAAVMSLVGDGDEVEKRITALLLGGRSHIQLDNVRVLRSSHLEAALTTLTWSGRRLGKSEAVYVPNRATWLATGNNVEVSDEMARRSVPIRLDAGVERPEDRNGFRYQLPAWAYKTRPALVTACLSIIQDWLAAGQPQGTAVLGRFEVWAKTTGGLVEFAGFPGFLQNRKRLQSQADSETQEWAAVVGLWWESYSNRPVTAGDLFEIIKEHSLLLNVWGGRSKTGALQRLGHALGKKRDRIYGGFAIRAAGLDGVTRNTAYRLELTTGARGADKTPETPETTGANLGTPDFAGFAGVDNFGCFASEVSKTPGKTTENTRPPSMGVSGVLQNGIENTRHESLENTDFSGVSGVSGVLSPPRPPGENAEREPGKDTGGLEPWDPAEALKIDYASADRFAGLVVYNRELYHQHRDRFTAARDAVIAAVVAKDMQALLDAKAQEDDLYAEIGPAGRKEAAEE